MTSSWVWILPQTTSHKPTGSNAQYLSCLFVISNCDRYPAITETKCWLTVSWPVGWNFSEISIAVEFHRENMFRNVGCKMVPILFRHQCDNVHSNQRSFWETPWTLKITNLNSSKNKKMNYSYIESFVQDGGDSSALAIQLLQSCTKPRYVFTQVISPMATEMTEKSSWIYTKHETPWHWNASRITDPLWEESTGHQGHAELWWFLFLHSFVPNMRQAMTDDDLHWPICAPLGLNEWYYPLQ